MTAVALPGAAVNGAVCGAGALWRRRRNGRSTSGVIPSDPISHTARSRPADPPRATDPVEPLAIQLDGSFVTVVTVGPVLSRLIEGVARRTCAANILRGVRIPRITAPGRSYGD